MCNDAKILDLLSNGHLIVNCNSGVIFTTRKKGSEGKKVRLRSVKQRGYHTYVLKYEGKAFKAQGHRIVYLAYHKEIPENYEIDHKNRKRYDNKISNLQAISKIENLSKRKW